MLASDPQPKRLGRAFMTSFFLTHFCRDKFSRSCFTGQFPGIGAVFYTGQSPDVQNPKAKSKRKVH